MDKININGIILTPLKIINHPKGNLFHCMKKIDEGYAGFGEAYFSSINFGEIKGWNRHKKMTLNFIIPMGSVTFIIYDEREKSPTKGSFNAIKLSPNFNYKRLTIPPELWVAFKGNDKNTNLILNIANMAHDPNELEKVDLDNFSYNFDSN
jgi:dTDP-4-dehydrorhamnose 3,5-epimerase